MKKKGKTINESFDCEVERQREPERSLKQVCELKFIFKCFRLMFVMLVLLSDVTINCSSWLFPSVHVSTLYSASPLHSSFYCFSVWVLISFSSQFFREKEHNASILHNYIYGISTKGSFFPDTCSVLPRKCNSFPNHFSSTAIFSCFPSSVCFRESKSH